MEYNDEQLLNINDYEIMAKAYANELKKRGFMVVQIDSEQSHMLANTIFEKMLQIKSKLFLLGGFLNTGKFYSLNDRQIKKFSLLFDLNFDIQNKNLSHDKTKVFLSFLSDELEVVKHLIELSEKSNYENEIKKIIEARLTLLSQILAQ